MKSFFLLVILVLPNPYNIYIYSMTVTVVLQTILKPQMTVPLLQQCAQTAQLFLFKICPLLKFGTPFFHYIIRE